RGGTTVGRVWPSTLPDGRPGVPFRDRARAGWVRERAGRGPEVRNPMSTQPVVAAVDGSDDSLRALEWAVDAARRRAAPLRVVHVRQYAAWGQPEVLAAGPPAPEEDPVL